MMKCFWLIILRYHYHRTKEYERYFFKTSLKEWLRVSVCYNDLGLLQMSNDFLRINVIRDGGDI